MRFLLPNLKFASNVYYSWQVMEVLSAWWEKSWDYFEQTEGHLLLRLDLFNNSLIKFKSSPL